ncbi:hypothetical protein [Derxia gummosa]|uniref:Transmembrane protein n=1 Tax=Derxia gummosa DSM 723 TaxID=1121388 RepID=A0A8B6X5A8_9BURK|nr:hypothetical protein [Derxia gummosa]
MPATLAVPSPRPPRRLWPLWAVLAVSLAPLLAALAAWSLDWPGARGNYGALVDPPRALPALATLDLGGRPVDMRQSASRRAEPTSLSLAGGVPPALAGNPSLPRSAAHPPRWRMLVAAPAACDAACRHHLWLTRQLRAGTGEDRVRIERVWLVTDGAMPDAALLAEHPDLTVLRVADGASRAALLRWLGDGGSAPRLLDPRDELMLAWPAASDGARMRRDLARLLKVSRIG